MTKKIGAREDVSKIQPTDERVDYADTLVKGLRLRVLPIPNGEKSWSLRYRDAAGVLQRLGLGLFAKDPKRGLTLEAARREAEIKKGEIKKGADPAGEKRKARKAAKVARLSPPPKAGTVGETCAAYLATRGDIRPTTAREWERLAARIADYFGTLPVKDLTRVTVREWLATLRNANHPTLRDEAGKPVKVKGYSANRSLEFLRLALDWAADEGRIPANPAAGLRRPRKRDKRNNDILARETRRERALSKMEVRAVLLALDGLEKDAHRKSEGGATADALRLALLTGKRRSGVLGLRRSELSGLDGDEPLWELPAEREKNGKAHDVPLSPEALAIIGRRLEACDARLELARTEAKEAGAKPHPTIGQFLWATHRDPRARKEPWWSRPEHEQQWLPQKFIKKLKERAAEIHGTMKPWTPHALRATFATLLDDALEVDHRIVSLLLNHKLDDVSSKLGYNLAKKASERREALKTWGESLREWKETEPGKLLPYKARA